MSLSMAATSTALVPVLRLYRGEARSETRASRPAWMRAALEEQGVMAAFGRWFTNALAIAAWYAEDAGDGRIVTLDVPAPLAVTWRVTRLPEARRFSRDPEREFFLPREWARRARPLAPHR